MNQLANQIFSSVVVIAVLQGSCCEITISFCLVKFMTILPFLVLLWMIVCLIGITGVIIFLVKKSINIRVFSEILLTSFQKFDFKQNPASTRFWKSCLPLNMKVGPFGSIETHEFLLILFGDMIINNTLTLLISTRWIKILEQWSPTTFTNTCNNLPYEQLNTVLNYAYNVIIPQQLRLTKLIKLIKLNASF